VLAYLFCHPYPYSQKFAQKPLCAKEQLLPYHYRQQNILAEAS